MTMEQKMKRRVAMPYQHALFWLIHNDDCEWLADPEAPQSLTAAFIADCYGRADDVLRRDLLRERTRS
jgi:hypothetical protein